MLGFRPLCAVPLASGSETAPGTGPPPIPVGDLTLISTIMGSQHPVDCYIEGSQPGLRDRNLKLADSTQLPERWTRGTKAPPKRR